MAKVQTVGSISEFMSGAYKAPKATRKPQTYKEALKDVVQIVSMSGLAYRALSIDTVLAATADATFGNIHSTLMKMFDAGVVLIIIFAGASWSLGHRTKAIEILIGVCCGYVLARHAVDIQRFLSKI
jgi:hypothetical protein